MRRIDNGTQVAALPTPSAAVGTPGYASNGDPASGVQATIWDADMANTLIEEFMAFLTAAGIAPDRNNRAQVLAAVRAMFAPGLQEFTSSGVFTVPAGITRVRATVVGAGGGGAGCTPSGGTFLSGAGGGGGGAAIGVLAVTPGATIAVTVGIGGAGGGTNNGAGGGGGTSSLGSFLSATGGAGGYWSTTSTSPGGTPGAGTGGQINVNGGYGGDGQGASQVLSGYGGNSLLGGGGRAAQYDGIPGQSYGSGGGGGYSVPSPGGRGANGIVFLEW